MSKDRLSKHGPVSELYGERKKKITFRYGLTGIVLVFLRLMCVHVCKSRARYLIATIINDREI